MAFITLTDTKDNAVRVNVDHIRYYRTTEDGTGVCLGGTGGGRLVIAVKETPDEIDAKLGPRAFDARAAIG